MDCPRCGSPDNISHGKTRRFCKGCDRSFSTLPPGKPGRRTLDPSGRKLTAYEKFKRCKRVCYAFCEECGDPAFYLSPPLCNRHYAKRRYQDKKKRKQQQKD